MVPTGLTHYMGGPDMAPHTPQRSRRAGEAGALLDDLVGARGSERSRGLPNARRASAAHLGRPRSSRPGCSGRGARTVGLTP